MSNFATPEPTQNLRYATQPGSGRYSIVLDAMGGDFSPKNEVLGAAEALKMKPGAFRIIFVGRRTEIERYTSNAAIASSDYEILEADDIITMHDEPVQALRRKPNSSIVRGFNHVASGKADAFVSAGNTGAVMSGATLLLGRLKGVSRPTIGSQFPQKDGGYTLLFDVGATVDSKAIHLREYAMMGSIYAREMFGVQRPRVGLLSVGEEASKGNELVFEAAKLLVDSNLEFIGNVEGRDILSDAADVIVCDGFVGNVVLKFAESVLTLLKTRLRAYADKKLSNKIKAAFVASALRVVLKDFDYQEYGGVPLLGVKGVTIIGHGSSTPKAIRNMILKADEMLEKNVNARIEAALAAAPTTKPTAET